MEGGLTPTHYGRRSIENMWRCIQEHRAAVQAEGSPRVQASWDRCEEFIDFVFTGTEKEGR